MSTKFYTGNIVLPVVSFSECNPEINESEIQHLYVARKYSKPLNDWTKRDEWLLRASQDDLSPDAIRRVNIIGDVPLPNISSLNISGRRIKDSDILRTINIDVDETNSSNYDFSRFTEFDIWVRLWYATKGGKLFGGNNGIIGRLKIFPVYGRGAEEIEKFTGTFTWHSQCSPERIDNPLKDVLIGETKIIALLGDGNGRFLQNGYNKFLKIK